MSNRLSMERSPYLLQHMDNPVDWHPWGLEVFEEAKRLDKPVFLLRYARLSGNGHVREMALRTLDAMCRGGACAQPVDSISELDASFMRNS